MKLGPKNALWYFVSIWTDTIQLIPEPRTWKMAIIVPRRRRGTWEGVTVANWCSEWICRMWRGLGPHTLIFPASLSLLRMWGAVICRLPTILQNISFYTRISYFVQSSVLSAAGVATFTSETTSWLPDRVYRSPPCTIVRFFQRIQTGEYDWATWQNMWLLIQAIHKVT